MPSRQHELKWSWLAEHSHLEGCGCGGVQHFQVQGVRVYPPHLSVLDVIHKLAFPSLVNPLSTQAWLAACLQQRALVPPFFTPCAPVHPESANAR